MNVATTPRLERRDVTIRLTGEKMNPEAIEQYVTPLIEERLRVLVEQGWEADGATDVLALWGQGRLACREHASFWLDTPTYNLSSVTIRLRRISTA